jgi:hypothetical protein
VWQYQWGTVQSDGSITNTVIDPAGNSTVRTFSPVAFKCSLYETNSSYYQGAATAGAQPVKQVVTQYTGILGGYEDGSPAAANVVPVSILTTLGATVNLVTKSYDSGDGHGFIFGNVLTENDYDWGSGAPGSLLRKIVSTYMWQSNNSPYLASSLVDLLATVVTQDGSGNKVAETDYAYDEFPLQSSNVTTGVTAPYGSVRGNLTTTSRWLNTGGAVVTHNYWYDTGMKYQYFDGDAVAVAS